MRDNKLMITEITRRDIYELFRDGIDTFDWPNSKQTYHYYGRLEEIEFLERLYDLDKLPSTDSRYKNAKEDIVQHTISNDDYDYCWVFRDERFGLISGNDDTFLQFLCEIFNPYVRDEKASWELFLNKVNELIRADGYELYVKEHISGRNNYGYRLCGAENASKMDNKAIIDLIDEFKSGLISKATDGDIDEKEYKRCRDTLMNIPQIKEALPAFIKSNRTSSDFRRYMQGAKAHYAERRTMISEGMDELKSRMETNNDPFMAMSEYKKMDLLGRGGFGSVYRYHNDCLDMDFAVKIYEPIFMSEEEQKEGERRFFREAKMLFSLNDKHLARIYDAGRLDGKPYIRMELIKGYNLEKFHERFGNLEFKRSAHAITHILAGLKTAHEHGIIHRDLRATNVLYAEEEQTFKIIDFGVSAFLDTENHTKLTKTGEQIAGGVFIDPLLESNPKLRDPRSDIYSVGSLWYYLLSGRAPSGSDMREYLKNANDSIEGWQVEMVMKCLAGNINDRYSSCDELLGIIKGKFDFRKQ